MNPVTWMAVEVFGSFSILHCRIQKRKPCVFHVAPMHLGI